MDIRREPYLLKFKKNNETAVAKKIKELQTAAEQQRSQTRGVLADEQPLIQPQYNRQMLPREQQIEEPEQTKTARKKPRCSVYLSQRNQTSQVEQPDHHADPQPLQPLPAIVIPGKEEDKEMEYLRSQEYMKYLEKLTQAHSKEEKVKVIKENRNNNVYLGKAGMMDRKQYIQEIIRTKEVLPRVNFQRFNQDLPQTQANRQQSNYTRGLLVDSIMLNGDTKDNLKENFSKKGQKEFKKRDILQDSPIRYANQQYEVPITKEKQSNNVTIILSPVCLTQQNFFKPTLQVKQIKQNNFQQEKPMKIELYYHNQPLKREDKTYNKMPSKQPSMNIISKPQEKYVKADTYRNEAKDHEKIELKTDRSLSNKQKRYEKKTLNYKKKDWDKENKKEMTPKSSSVSSSPSFTGKNKQKQNNIYNISFKIDKPNIQKVHYAQTTKKSIQPLKKRYSPNSYSYTPEKPRIIKHTQARQRQFTEYSQNTYPLGTSQATSAITRQENQNTSRSPRKITVISRSKHRKHP